MSEAFDGVLAVGADEGSFAVDDAPFDFGVGEEAYAFGAVEGGFRAETLLLGAAEMPCSTVDEETVPLDRFPTART